MDGLKQFSSHFFRSGNWWPEHSKCSTERSHFWNV